MRRKWAVYGILFSLLGLVTHLSYRNIYTLIFLASTLAVGVILIFFGTMKKEKYP